jgi:formyltetrahydrofolate hydrolase
MPIKASKLVLLIIERYDYCFSQVEFNKKKINWIHSNINKILSNCKFIKSHIDYLNAELKELKRKKSKEPEISNIEKKLNISRRKLTDIVTTLRTFLLEQFFLD